MSHFSTIILIETENVSLNLSQQKAWVQARSSCGDPCPFLVTGLLKDKFILQRICSDSRNPWQTHDVSRTLKKAAFTVCPAEIY